MPSSYLDWHPSNTNHSCSCHIAVYAAAMQTLENSKCPYFQILLSYKTTVRWVFLHRPSLNPLLSFLEYDALCFPTYHLKLLLCEWKNFKLALSPLPPTSLKNQKNVLKFLEIRRHSCLFSITIQVFPRFESILRRVV